MQQLNPIIRRIHCKVFGDPYEVDAKERAENVALISKALVFDDLGTLHRMFKEGPLITKLAGPHAAEAYERLVDAGFADYIIVKGKAGFVALNTNGRWLKKCVDAVRQMFPDEIEA